MPADVAEQPYVHVDVGTPLISVAVGDTTLTSDDAVLIGGVGPLFWSWTWIRPLLRSSAWP